MCLKQDPVFVLAFDFIFDFFDFFDFFLDVRVPCGHLVDSIIIKVFQ